MSPVLASIHERDYTISWAGRPREGDPILGLVGTSSVLWKPEGDPIHDRMEKALKHSFMHSNRSFSDRVDAYRGYSGKKPLDSYALYYTYSDFDGHRNDHSNAVLIASIVPDIPDNLVCVTCGNTELFLGKELSDVVVSSNLTVMRRTRKDRKMMDVYHCKACGGAAVRAINAMELLENGRFRLFRYQ